MATDEVEVKRHLRTQLRQVSSVRIVGFRDAVEDLGTHLVCGHPVHYSRCQVYSVLTGRAKSPKLLRRIAEHRPDLFDLHYVPESVRAEGLAYVKEVS